MRVLLIPPKNNYPNPEPDATSFIQGVPMLAGMLKAAGHEVFGLNMNYKWCHGSAPLTLEIMLREAISKYQPQLIGIGGLAPDYLFIRDVIFFVRRIAPDIPIVCGGRIVTHDSLFIFSDLKPDFAIVGEGEIAIVKLVEYLERGGNVNSVPSLVHWKNGEPVFNPTMYPEELDDLPFPDYDLFDIETYFSVDNQINNFFTHTLDNPKVLPLQISRSCPFKCTFCSQMEPYRSRSIDNAILELSHFYEKYQFNSINIYDELFSIKHEKIYEFCEKLTDFRKASGAQFDWGCYLHVKKISPDLVKAMKDAGCTYIGYGMESASDTVLKSMKKGATSAEMKNAIKVTSDAGIGVHGNFIFGDIAETPETIKETIDFYDQYCRDLTVYNYYVVPYPGSALYNYCEENNLIKDKKAFYETTLHQKGFLNMTSMSDDEFRRLTEPVMTSVLNDKYATVLAMEKVERESCDLNAPFELRRYFYRIEAECPHCLEQVEYTYPLKIQAGKKVDPFIHSCTKCHKKFVLDVSTQVMTLPQEDISYSTFIKKAPYTNYYPFVADEFRMVGSPTPLLVDSHEGYNLIRYANDYIAVHQGLGQIDVPLTNPEKLEECTINNMYITGLSVGDLKMKIDHHLNLIN